MILSRLYVSFQKHNNNNNANVEKLKDWASKQSIKIKQFIV